MMVKEENRKRDQEVSDEAIRKKVDDVLYKLALIDFTIYSKKNRSKKEKC